MAFPHTSYYINGLRRFLKTTFILFIPRFANSVSRLPCITLLTVEAAALCSWPPCWHQGLLVWWSLVSVWLGQDVVQLLEQRWHSQHCQAVSWNRDYCHNPSSPRAQLASHAHKHPLFQWLICWVDFKGFGLKFSCWSLLLFFPQSSSPISHSMYFRFAFSSTWCMCRWYPAILTFLSFFPPQTTYLNHWKTLRKHFCT